MRRAILALLTTALIFVGAAPAALADHDKGNPHFIRASATLVGTDLRVDFKEAGLGSDPDATVTIVASADASRFDACQNKGGNFPSDPKKQQTTAAVEASGEFSPGKNGQITDSLTLSLPATSLECPPGQNAVLVSFEYSNVSVTDITHDVSRDVPGTFGAVLIPGV